MRAKPVVEVLEERACLQASVLWVGGEVLIAPRPGPAIVAVTVHQGVDGRKDGVLEVAVWQQGRADVTRLPMDAVNEIVCLVGNRQAFVNTSELPAVVFATTLGPRGRD